MQVNFFATLRKVVGQKSVFFALEDGTTISRLIDQMVTRYPGLRRELLDDDGKLHGHVRVFVNGVDLLHLEKQMETVLYSSDVVNVFPAVGGG